MSDKANGRRVFGAVSVGVGDRPPTLGSVARRWGDMSGGGSVSVYGDTRAGDDYQQTHWTIGLHPADWVQRQVHYFRGETLADAVLKASLWQDIYCENDNE